MTTDPMPPAARWDRQIAFRPGPELYRYLHEQAVQLDISISEVAKRFATMAAMGWDLSHYQDLEALSEFAEGHQPFVTACTFARHQVELNKPEGIAQLESSQEHGILRAVLQVTRETRAGAERGA